MDFRLRLKLKNTRIKEKENGLPYAVKVKLYHFQKYIHVVLVVIQKCSVWCDRWLHSSKLVVPKRMRIQSKDS